MFPVAPGEAAFVQIAVYAIVCFGEFCDLHIAMAGNVFESCPRCCSPDPIYDVGLEEWVHPTMSDIHLNSASTVVSPVAK
eukprot:8969266-Ditylum_brightwellii.AAC.1